MTTTLAILLTLGAIAGSITLSLFTCDAKCRLLLAVIGAISGASSMFVLYCTVWGILQFGGGIA